MTPAEFILALLIHEAPAIDRKPEARTAWEKEIATAVELDAKVAQAGALVSPDVDTALIDSMRWYEARLRSKPKDGDCHHVMVKGTNLWKLECDAVGPLQVQWTALRAVRETPEGIQLGLVPTMEIDALREPEMGVRAGYATLVRWKAICGGSPARWITAWGWGKCPKNRTAVDREAVRRCELAVVLLLQRGKLGEWKCGHEGRKIRDPHDQRLLKWARSEAIRGEP